MNKKYVLDFGSWLVENKRTPMGGFRLNEAEDIKSYTLLKNKDIISSKLYNESFLKELIKNIKLNSPFTNPYIQHKDKIAIVLNAIVANTNSFVERPFYKSIIENDGVLYDGSSRTIVPKSVSWEKRDGSLATDINAIINRGEKEGSGYLYTMQYSKSAAFLYISKAYGDKKEERINMGSLPCVYYPNVKDREKGEEMTLTEAIKKVGFGDISGKYFSSDTFNGDLAEFQKLVNEDKLGNNSVLALASGLGLVDIQNPKPEDLASIFNLDINAGNMKDVIAALSNPTALTKFAKNKQKN